MPARRVNVTSTARGKRRSSALHGGAPRWTRRRARPWRRLATSPPRRSAARSRGRDRALGRLPRCCPWAAAGRGSRRVVRLDRARRPGLQRRRAAARRVAAPGRRTLRDQRDDPERRGRVPGRASPVRRGAPRAAVAALAGGHARGLTPRFRFECDHRRWATRACDRRSRDSRRTSCHAREVECDQRTSSAGAVPADPCTPRGGAIRRRLRPV